MGVGVVPYRGQEGVPDMIIDHEIPGYDNYIVTSNGKIYNKSSGKKLSPVESTFISETYSLWRGNKSTRIRLENLIYEQVLKLDIPKGHRVYFDPGCVNKDVKSVNLIKDGEVIILWDLISPHFREHKGYLVDRFGDVFRPPRVSYLGGKLRFVHSPKRLCPGKREDGRLQVSSRGLPTVKVHRLAAEAWIPNPLNLPQVNHKDGNPENNSIENLEWVTDKDNKVHAINNGLYPLGEDRSQTRLPDSHVLEIVKRVEQGECRKALAKEYGTHISNINKYARKSARKYLWQ